mmetsp:Transcript_74803/g.148188  ORF Transcript_74803/g.148188 Transcript_74803/m.148188 type:complete len:268 (+) Transcript_74803:65-868(+)
MANNVMRREKRGSVASLLNSLIILIGAFVAARVYLEMVHSTGATSLPAVPDTGCEDEVVDMMLVEAELSAIDLVALQRELTANSWTGKTWLVKVLLNEGAEDMRIGPSVNHRRNMTFSLGLGIPWTKIDAFLRMQKTGSAAPAVVEKAQQVSSVEATHTVEMQQSDGWGLRSTYIVPGLSVKLDIEVDFQERHRGGRAFVHYRFSANVEFTDTGPGNIFRYRFIRWSTELGFAAAVRRFGMALLAEVKAHPVVARHDRFFLNSKARP